MIHSRFFSQEKKITSQPGVVLKNGQRHWEVCSGMHYSYCKVKMGLSALIRIYFYIFGGF